MRPGQDARGERAGHSGHGVADASWAAFSLCETRLAPPRAYQRFSFTYWPKPLVSDHNP